MFQLCVALACLFLAGPTGVQPQSDAVTLDMLKQTKAIEAYITGQYKFRETNSAGGSYDSFDSFASFGVGNVNTAKNPKNTVPSWDGFNFSIVLAQSIRDGETENMTMSGNFSTDLSKIENMTVKKNISDSEGHSKSVQWTFKNLPGGKINRAYYSNKRSTQYQVIIPVNEIPKYLADVAFTEKRPSGVTVTYIGAPSKEDIEAEYKGSAYLDSYLTVQFSVTFTID